MAITFNQFLEQTQSVPEEHLAQFSAEELESPDFTHLLLERDMLSATYLKHLQETFEKTPFEDVMQYSRDEALQSHFPEHLARRHNALLLNIDADGEYLIGLCNPLDDEAMDQLSESIHAPIRWALINAEACKKITNLWYRKTSHIAKLAQQMSDELDRRHGSNEGGQLKYQKEALSSQLLNAILTEGMQLGASDIHLEYDEDNFRVRLRVDGKLQEQVLPQQDIAAAIFRCLRIMARLDISQNQQPQDGRLDLYLSGQAQAARLSILPTRMGESAVIRLLGNAMAYNDLSASVTDPEVESLIKQHLSRSQGMILVTGPTGSGKTTTLYSALMHVNTPDNKIITLEDPVETTLPRINQVQIDHESNLSFADVLRASLRQDPDIMMVGEVRDGETANIAMRSAMTGQMVLATLHTNGVISTITRLANLNIESAMLGAALRLIIAQRLVRLSCPHCAKAESPSLHEQVLYEKAFSKKLASGTTFKKSTGCERCQFTGYQGRRPVFETLEITPDMVASISQGDYAEFTNKATAQVHGKRLIDQALKLAEEGLTSLDEALRLTE